MGVHRTRSGDVVNCLRSPTAAEVNIEIMRTLVRLRRLMATPSELVEPRTKLAETVQLHDDPMKVITHPSDGAR